ncbi:MAG: nucleotidyl transferase AbiEii/AbiGii toxin family protein [Ekhidna sp.]
MLHRSTVSKELLNLFEELCSISTLNHFALAGGTALSLHKGHRISIDLDFFSIQAFDTASIALDLKKFSPKIISSDINTLSLIINQIKVDFLRHNYPLLKPIQKIDNLRLYSMMDIAAMKINAIINRGAKKDFFDLEILLRDFSKEDLFDFYQEKYGKVSDLMFVKSMLFFDDAENDPDPRNPSIDWVEVKERIKNTFL